MKLVIKDGVIYPNQFFKFVTVGYIFAVGTYTLLLALVISVFYVVHNSLYQETSFEIFSDLGIPLPVVFLIFVGGILANAVLYGGIVSGGLWLYKKLIKASGFKVIMTN